jgi:hypothetical protein
VNVVNIGNVGNTVTLINTGMVCCYVEREIQ